MEANNMVAMREALEAIDELTNLLDIPEDKKNLLVSPSHSFIAVKMRRIIKKALEEPPRNCDVGTVAEQEVRFDDFCMAHKEIKEPGLKVCLDSCPLVKKGFCDLHWAQMPYEEGGTK